MYQGEICGPVSLVPLLNFSSLAVWETRDGLVRKSQVVQPI